MEGNKKFVVDQGGSARGENISPEEVNQAVKDIVNWQKTGIPGFVPTQGLNEVPENMHRTVSLMLKQHNGGIHLQETFITLSLNGIRESNELCRVSIYWNANYIPFARNSEGEYLIVNMEVGEVLQWNLDSGVVDQLCKSLELYLETFRNNLLCRKLQYLGPDCGLIESV
ncbi:hypothetical protein SteCoe_17103 [Stentor coeruleus]|uniref:Uncharacterized protein n=1 Tax=Stentor coeruleus TaxID=5963 RepID=A0A1R2BZV7_9CILI|nr:hypothetical protein SteCoe_17103 [Stentor coeruleus]